MKTVISLLLVLSWALTACQNPSGSSNTSSTSTAVLTRFGITGATGLVIMPASAISRSMARGSTSGVNEVFQVTASGALLQVTSYDQTGAPMTLTENPIFVGPAGSNYFLFIFGPYLNDPVDAYLVRQSDGAVFQVPKAFLPTAVEYFGNTSLVQTDSAGNLYWRTLTQVGAQITASITKVNVSNPANLTAQTISPQTESINGFFANGNGDVLYGYYTPPSGSPTGFQIRAAGGSLSNLPGTPSLAFATPSGTFEYTFYQNSTVGLYSDSVSSAGVVTTTPVAVPEPSPFEGYNDAGDFLFTINNEQYIAGSGYLTRVYSSINNLGLVTGNPLTSFATASASGTTIYLAGNDSSGNPKLVAYDPTNGFRTILPGFDGALYSVYSLNVSSSGNILFNALRMSDGTKVIGTVSASGVTSVVDSTFNATVVSLVQIK